MQLHRMHSEWLDHFFIHIIRVHIINLIEGTSDKKGIGNLAFLEYGLPLLSGKKHEIKNQEKDVFPERKRDYLNTTAMLKKR
jgi:hypothetical protein